MEPGELPGSAGDVTCWWSGWGWQGPPVSFPLRTTVPRRRKELQAESPKGGGGRAGERPGVSPPVLGQGKWSGGRRMPPWWLAPPRKAQPRSSSRVDRRLRERVAEPQGTGCSRRGKERASQGPYNNGATGFALMF